MWAKFLTNLAKKIEAWMNKSKEKVTPPILKPEPKPQETSGLPVGVDALEWSTIHWYGQNNASKAIPTKILRGATIYGDNRVILDYDTNADWPAICPAVEGCRSSFLVFTNAIDGALRGGHTDHMRLNAKERDLGNLYNGYIMAGVPRNKDLYIAIASHDGRQRSNVVLAVRK